MHVVKTGVNIQLEAIFDYNARLLKNKRYLHIARKTPDKHDIFRIEDKEV